MRTLRATALPVCTQAASPALTEPTPTGTLRKASSTTVFIRGVSSTLRNQFKEKIMQICNYKEYSVQRPRLTGDTQGTDCVLIDREAHFQCMSSHVLIEYITSCEIQYTTVILISGDKPRIEVEENYGFRTNI